MSYDEGMPCIHSHCNRCGADVAYEIATLREMARVNKELQDTATKRAEELSADFANACDVGRRMEQRANDAERRAEEAEDRADAIFALKAVADEQWRKEYKRAEEAEARAVQLSNALTLATERCSKAEMDLLWMRRGLVKWCVELRENGKTTDVGHRLAAEVERRFLSAPASPATDYYEPPTGWAAATLSTNPDADFSDTASPATATPVCERCKNTGWRKIDGGLKAMCLCPIEDAERAAMERTPDGRINNCALANGDVAANCQMCRGVCPDAARGKGE